MNVQVKIKRLHKNAVFPAYAKEGDAGMDLTAISYVFDEHGAIVYGTGIAIEIPEGYVGLLFPRSSNSKKDLILSNSVGVVDSGYRGEIMFKYKPVSFFADSSPFNEGGQITDNFDFISVGKETDEDDFQMQLYDVGDRIGQIMIIPIPRIEFIEAEELSDSERGEGGYGSTGK
jgi:dUTP pyrophosphatase